MPPRRSTRLGSFKRFANEAGVTCTGVVRGPRGTHYTFYVAGQTDLEKENMNSIVEPIDHTNALPVPAHSTRKIGSDWSDGTGEIPCLSLERLATLPTRVSEPSAIPMGPDYSISAHSYSLDSAKGANKAKPTDLVDDSITTRHDPFDTRNDPIRPKQSGSECGQYYSRTDLKLIDLGTGQDAFEDDKPPSDGDLINLYEQLSNKVLHALYPSVWTKNGLWKKEYAHLERPRPKHDKTIQDREGMRWCILFGKVFQCCPASIAPGWTRIVISFVRSSQSYPVFGSKGMIQRAISAGNAWIQLEQERPALLVVNARSWVSSSADLLSPEGGITEIRRLLQAASQRQNLTVEIVSVGIDAFSTNVTSMIQFREEFMKLDLRLVYIVPPTFPESDEVYMQRSNGIRYAEFRLDDVAAVGSQNLHGYRNEKDLVKLLNHINASKKHLIAGDKYITWTQGRNAFRVCPDSILSSGVNEGLRIKRNFEDYDQ
ncbi:uncharacterized protein FFUJ_02550 [Fusarium fujikuroi IMI 58289]|uniref:Uncharacterized protein n=1 Tax=Gibberella fujikuroi (strain CBS 195.34 / IMI 58289 / NRRL A-6831) TaxID=1279085 RepID=S0DSR4_GIBF5|nr:uncharacterized protein FFUJ_02550 [Fusarium fujikuroi IMI 58289]CCT65594.1 uncharacterized protein FFUJ_02550 [Fusarium fujikuroi IMI 58289]SCN77805.1 uncharacterized protein FFM5_01695 [Fusarium fujikuroi]